MAPKKSPIQPVKRRPASKNADSVDYGRPTQALVFISHDSRDADLAEEFGHLLQGASGGMLKTFCSSDRKGSSGIEYGEESFRAIMNRLAEATAAVALLTPLSFERPWVLFEIGVAKGKIENSVFGLAIGLSPNQANKGPLYFVQNCMNDEDSLVKLVTQLITKNTYASPRPEAIRLHVQLFQDNIEKLLKKRGAQGGATTSDRIDDLALAKLFEETKAVLRDVSEKVLDRERALETTGQKAWLQNSEVSKILEILGKTAVLTSPDNNKKVEKFLFDVYQLIRPPLERIHDLNAHDTLDLFERMRMSHFKKSRYQPPPPPSQSS